MIGEGFVLLKLTNTNKRNSATIENEHLSYSIFFPVKITKGSQKSFHKKTNY